MVMATQNPIEQEGTYPLPEAQVDRFMFKLLVEYPARNDERNMLDRMTGAVKPHARAGCRARNHFECTTFGESKCTLTNA